MATVKINFDSSQITAVGYTRTFNQVKEDGYITKASEITVDLYSDIKIRYINVSSSYRHPVYCQGSTYFQVTNDSGGVLDTGHLEYCTDGKTFTLTASEKTDPPPSTTHTLTHIWRAYNWSGTSYKDYPSTITVDSSITGKSGTHLLPLEPMVPNGAVFLGWVDSSGKAVQTTVYYSLYGQTDSIYPSYGYPHTILCTLILAGGTLPPGWTTTVQNTIYKSESTGALEVSVALPTPTREGFDFDCWYCEETSETYTDNYVEEVYKGTTSRTLTAKWKAKTPTYYAVINIKKNNGTVDEVKTPGSDTYQLTTTITVMNPTRDGYTFNGWKIEKTPSTATAYFTETTLTVSIDTGANVPVYILTAQWIQHTTATYIYSSGVKTFTTSSAQVFLGEKLTNKNGSSSYNFTFPNNTPECTDTNFTFNKWQITVPSGPGSSSVSSANPGDTISLTLNTSGNIVYQFTALWTKKIYVVFDISLVTAAKDANGKVISISVNNANSLRYLESNVPDILSIIPIMSGTPVQTGYFFKNSWHLEGETGSIQSGSSFTIDTPDYKDATLNETTREKVVKVTLNLVPNWDPYKYQVKIEYKKNAPETSNNTTSFPSDQTYSYEYGKELPSYVTLNDDFSGKFTINISSTKPVWNSSKKWFFKQWKDSNNNVYQPGDEISIIVNKPTSVDANPSIKTITLQAIWQEGGIVWIYYNGSWARAVPYIYTGGSWKQARPWIYKQIGTDNQGKPIYEWR